MTGKLAAATVVTPDLEASIHFYQDLLGYTLTESGEHLAGESPRAYALLTKPEKAVIRLLAIAPGAKPNRPRPGANAWDPGFAVLELGMRDKDESYQMLTKAGVKTISPPLPYGFENAGTLGTVSVHSYAAFGPGGEQLFITHSVSSKPRPQLQELHGAIGNIVLPTLDREATVGFYRDILEVVPLVDEPCQQETVNQIIGAPASTYFDMVMVGPNPEAGTIGLEIEVYRVPSATTYPTSFDQTGLASAAWPVDNLPAARRRCEAHGVPIISDAVLPLPGNPKPSGFYVRGTCGELLEIIQAP